MSEKDKNDQMERFGRIAVDFYASQNILHTTHPFFAEVCMSFASDFVRTRHVKVVVSIWSFWCFSHSFLYSGEYYLCTSPFH